MLVYIITVTVYFGANTLTVTSDYGGHEVDKLSLTCSGSAAPRGAVMAHRAGHRSCGPSALSKWPNLGLTVQR